MLDGDMLVVVVFMVLVELLDFDAVSRMASSCGNVSAVRSPNGLASYRWEVVAGAF